MWKKVLKIITGYPAIGKMDKVAYIAKQIDRQSSF